MTRRYHYFWSCAVLLLTTGLMGMVTVVMAVHERPIAVRPIPAPPAMAVQRGWRASHLLVDGCPCSQAVAIHLLQRGPVGGMRERVYMIADQPEAQAGLLALLHQRGFETTVITAAEAQRTIGVRGGPMMMVMADDGRCVYAGGYGPGRPSATSMAGFYRDREIIMQLRAGGDMPPYPVVGCSAAQSPGQIWSDIASVLQR